MGRQIGCSKQARRMPSGAGKSTGGAGQRPNAGKTSVFEREEAVLGRIESVSSGAAYRHADHLAVGLDNETFGHFSS